MSAFPHAEAGMARSPDYILVSAPPPVVLAYGIDVDSTALLVELEARGEAPDLVLSADPGAEKPETYAYQEMMAHIPLFAHPNPEKVLVIGGGDGGILREVAKHPGVKEIYICEIDADVIEYSKKYLPGLAKGYDDPRVTVKVMDGSIFMEENQDNFDVM